MNAREKIQVETLSKWVTVKLAPSEIHGIGVVAIKDMPEGTKLFADIMPEIFHLPVKTLKNNTPAFVYETLTERWPLVAQGSAFVYPDTRFVAYMNHSDDPNYCGKTDTLLRNVKEGEEITEDYRLIEGYEEIYPWLKN